MPSTDDNSPVIISNILSRRTSIASMKLFLLILLMQIMFSRLGRWQQIHLSHIIAGLRCVDRFLRRSLYVFLLIVLQPATEKSLILYSILIRYKWWIYFSCFGMSISIVWHFVQSDVNSRIGLCYWYEENGRIMEGKKIKDKTK
jgi:hypothetical protein